MHRLVLILLGVFVATFFLSILNLMMKEGLILPDAFKVAVCAFSRIIQAFLSGRFNVHSNLATTQCMSDML